MKKYMLTEALFLKRKKEALEKILDCKFIRLIRVKKVMMQIMKLLEYKHLLVNLKTNN